MNLLSGGESRRAIRGYLTSREWWVLLDPENRGLFSLVEEGYYAGEANADFHVLFGMVSGRFVSLAFAHKRRMSRSQLSKLAEISVPEGKDILCATEDPVVAFAELKLLEALAGATADGPIVADQETG